MGVALDRLPAVYPFLQLPSKCLTARRPLNDLVWDKEDVCDHRRKCLVSTQPDVRDHEKGDQAASEDSRNRRSEADRCGRFEYPVIPWAAYSGAGSYQGFKIS
jgi:hypothetical protein